MGSDYRSQTDGFEDGNAVHRILATISEAVNTDVVELRPSLANKLDTDALEQLLHSADETVRVTFQYQQRVVEIRGDGVIVVTDRSGEE
ncbi:hypothetical protein HUG10_19840 (plasmid) [Halorarum halophilum]|uniref:Halobacterial output domain-containing protein n=1 Tax=Halorarum halophilum TaxID=2743090 RepID=A0A7D5GPI0_9EURY|nr:HalOD1 output domain-containing protein [Halobaculum halophilum]QLG29864.1 hypothetical protein HUG10_19840 [Halobaculum halophilum]